MLLIIYVIYVNFFIIIYLICLFCIEQEACYVIVERLESHLNLGVVMPGASTHELIKECLRFARSVTQDQLVYVRSERRQRTDQS